MGWKSCLASYVWFIPADKSSRETERGPGGNKWRARQIRRGQGEKVSKPVLIVKWDGKGESVREKRKDIRWWYYVLSPKQQQKRLSLAFSPSGQWGGHCSSNHFWLPLIHTSTDTQILLFLSRPCSSLDFFIGIIHRFLQILFRS